MSATARRARLLPIFAAALLFLIGLPATDLWAPDEPRYAQIADEMLGFERGARGLILLHLNGEPYTQKPPLFYWLAAAAGAPSGRVSETAARLPSALAGIAIVALTVGLGGALGGRGAGRVGVLGAWVLLSVLRFAHQARRAQLDLLLTAACTAALALFWHADTASRRGAPISRSTLVLLHGAVALGVLTKGPVGLLPYGVIVGYLAWEGRLREAGRFLPLWGLGIGTLPALAWISAAVALAPPGFFDSAVVDNLLGRFFTGTAHVRPVYYYAYQFPLDFLPWTPALLIAVGAALRQSRSAPTGGVPGERQAARFLLAWLGTFLVFFSISSGKRGLYMLPVFPAAALLCGAALDRALARGRSLGWLMAGPIAALALLAIGAGLLALRPGLIDAPIPAALDLPGLAGLLAGVGLAGLAGAALCARACARRDAPLAVVLGSLLAIEALVFTRLLPDLDAVKSPRPIAEAAEALTSPEEQLAVYRNGAFSGGLEYYAGRRAVALESLEAVRAFVARGGRVIVVKERDRAALTDAIPSAIRASSRHGRRRIWLVEVERPSTPRAHREESGPAAARRPRPGGRGVDARQSASQAAGFHSESRSRPIVDAAHRLEF